jgi:molybdate/tungstate transport system permease protein
MAGTIAATGRVTEARRALNRIAFALLWLPGGVLLLFILLPLLRMAGVQSWQSLSSVAMMPDVRNAIWLSMWCAALTAVVAAILGTPLAYFLARGGGWRRRLIEALVDLPLAVPHTVAGIALLFVFGRRGMLGELFAPFGLQFWGTQAGIVVAMLFVSVPFMVNSARLGFAGVDPRLEKVARTLGASAFEVFYRVDLPLAWRGILTGAVLTYARSISEIGSVMVLAYYPMTAPVKIYDLYLQSGLEVSSAMAVLLLMITLSTFLILRAQMRPDGR